MSITTNGRWTSIFHVIAGLNETLFYGVHCLLISKSRNQALMHLGSGFFTKNTCRCFLEIDGSVRYKLHEWGWMVNGWDAAEGIWGCTVHFAWIPGPRQKTLKGSMCDVTRWKMVRRWLHSVVCSWENVLFAWVIVQWNRACGFVVFLICLWVICIEVIRE